MSNNPEARPRSPQAQTQVVPNPPPPVIPPAVQENIERITRALEAVNTNPDADEERQRAIDDLEAQRAMATWAFWMFVAAAITTILTGIGIYLIGRTLVYTRKTLAEAKDATRAARDAVEEAKKTTAAAERAAAIAATTAHLELRAYLSVEPGGINQLIASDQAMGHVAVRNVGKLPARNVTVFVHMKLSYESDTDFPVLPDSQTIDRVIQPGAEMRQGSDEILPITEITKSGKAVFVWGTANYDDGYGVRRFTRFCHRYATASYNRNEEWNRKATETRSMIDNDKARYHGVGNNAD